MDHPLYSLVLGMYDFWLFFNPKKNACCQCFHPEDEIDEALKAYFASIIRNE